MGEEHFLVSVGMMLGASLNVDQIPVFIERIKSFRQVKEIKLRSVGQYGHHMKVEGLLLSDMMRICHDALGVDSDRMKQGLQTPNLARFYWEGMRYQLTEWPDLGNNDRGYLTPLGTLEPFFEYQFVNGREGTNSSEFL